MKRLLFLLSILLLFVFLWGVLPSRDVSGSDGIVGAEICKGCHEDHYQSYLKSTHAKKGIPNSPASKDACESCHGPGAAHVEKSGERGVGIFIFSKKIADAKSKSAKCLSCHGDSRDLSFWDQGKHKVSDVSCDNCHTVHSGARKNLKAAQPDLCNICHRSIRAQQNKQSHHPIREGKIEMHGLPRPSWRVRGPTWLRPIPPMSSATSAMPKNEVRTCGSTPRSKKIA